MTDHSELQESFRRLFEAQGHPPAEAAQLAKAAVTGPSFWLDPSDVASESPTPRPTAAAKLTEAPAAQPQAEAPADLTAEEVRRRFELAKRGVFVTGKPKPKPKNPYPYKVELREQSPIIELNETGPGANLGGLITDTHGRRVRKAGAK